MTKKESIVTIHMVASLDGFIAKKDGSVDWLKSTDYYEKGVALNEEDIASFLAGIDCYVMGSHTYEQALKLGWPYGDAPVVVLSSRKLSPKNEHVSFYSGDLNKLVNDQLKPSYRNIWMVGGAELTKAFIRHNLADEIRVALMPIILGDGVSFFDNIDREQALHLKDVTAYQDGMVELWYQVKKGE